MEARDQNPPELLNLSIGFTRNSDLAGGTNKEGRSGFFVFLAV